MKQTELKKIGTIPPYGKYPNHPRNGSNERTVYQRPNGSIVTFVERVG